MSLLVPILVMMTLSIIVMMILQLCHRAFQTHDNPLIETVNRLLPQTQCGQCHYPGCKPYAAAIVEQSAPINQCPPGGEATVQALATLLNREVTPLEVETKPATVVYIDESACIGCTLCIQACPVDAIIGSAKHMHTVITDLCTGCDLCIPPCPVDCIEVGVKSLSTT